MRNTDPRRNKMRVFLVLATLCVLAAKAAPAEDGFVKFHPITQEQYDEILSLTDGKPVISEGRLISSGVAKFTGFTSGLATGWLPSVIKTFTSSNNSNKKKDQNFPLCVIDTNDLTNDYDDVSSSPRGYVDSNGYYRPSPEDGYYPPGPRPGGRPPYRPPYIPPPDYPGEDEEEEPVTTTEAPPRKKPIVNCIVVIKRPDDAGTTSTTTTTTTTRKPTTTKRPKPTPTPNPPANGDENYPEPPSYGPYPQPPYPYIDPWTMWYYYKLASAYADQAPPPPAAYPPPYPYPSYPKRPRQNDAVAYVERSPYPQFDYNSQYPKFSYQQSASSGVPYYVRPSIKQPKQIQSEPADSEELEDDKDFFSVRKIFG